MNASKHIFNTWLVALLLFPILFFVDCWLTDKGVSYDILLPLFLAGILFSLPSLLFCLFCFTYVRNATGNIIMQLLLWTLLASVSTFISPLLLCLIMFDLSILTGLACVIGAAVVAVVLSILLRLQQFFHCVTFKTTIYEKELV